MVINMPRTKLLYLSAVSAPQQVKFCEALQKYFEASFWFYESSARTRGAWWDLDLGNHCTILDSVVGVHDGISGGRYWVNGLSVKLDRLDPDIIILGGFSIPSNYIAYRWARRNEKRCVVFTERSRDKNGKPRGRSLVWRLLRWFYRDLDLVIVSSDDVLTQFRDEFEFGDRVVTGRYAADLDGYGTHPLRKPQPAYTYLFANRLTEIYNPLGALKIFALILAKYPGSRLLMNAAGELGELCRARIEDLGISESVEFLTGIQSWDQLHTVYARCDILILPANFSNGNFTILEAMASGMGVVVSDRVLGIGKIIKDGVNGFNCEPTIEAFVDRIEHYIRQPELFITHAEANRSLAEPFSAAGTAKLFFDTFSKKYYC